MAQLFLWIVLLVGFAAIFFLRRRPAARQRRLTVADLEPGGPIMYVGEGTLLTYDIQDGETIPIDGSIEVSAEASMFSPHAVWKDIHGGTHIRFNRFNGKRTVICSCTLKN